MSRTWPWALLELDATTDEREIRRAYARQLKLHRPDRDPQGFQQLRAALEQALQACHWAQYVEEDEDTDEEDIAVQGGDVPDAAEAPSAVVIAPPRAVATDAEPGRVHLPALTSLATLLQPALSDDEDDERAIDAQAVAACLADLLQDPRLSLPGVRQHVEPALLSLMTNPVAGQLLWPAASADFAWDVDDPAFAAAWPQVVASVQQLRLRQWAEDIVQACQQDAQSGLPQLQALLDSDALLSIDLRLAFYRQLAATLCVEGGVDADTFAALCPLLGWQANGFCPRELHDYQWRHLLQLVATREQGQRDQAQWQRLQAIAAGQWSVRRGERRAVRALLAPAAPSALAGLWPGLTDNVRQLLAQLQTAHPDLLARLAPATLAFWRQRALSVPGWRGLEAGIFWLATAGFSATFAAQPLALFSWLVLVFAYLLWLDPQLEQLLPEHEPTLRWLRGWRYAVAALLLLLPCLKFGLVLAPLLGDDVKRMAVRLGVLLCGLGVLILRHEARSVRGQQRLAHWRLVLAINGPLGLLRRCMLRPSWDGFEVASIVFGLGISCIYGLLIGCSYLF